MARARKRHVQQPLRYRDKNGQRRGGKRRGAGRPPKGPRSSERHKRREAVKKYDAVHVVLRTATRVGRLRKRHIYKALRKALMRALARNDFRVVHISIQGTHVHLLAEADNRLALARGMKAFEISAAKHINAALPRDARGARRRGTIRCDEVRAPSRASHHPPPAPRRRALPRRHPSRSVAARAAHRRCRRQAA